MVSDPKMKSNMSISSNDYTFSLLIKAHMNLAKFRLDMNIIDGMKRLTPYKTIVT